MVEPASSGWEDALEVFLKRTSSGLEESKRQWAIIGSVASVLQGCQLKPKDLDIIVKEPSTVYFINGLLKEFLVESSGEKDFFEEAEDDWWLSSKEEPVSQGPDQWGFTWIFARWLINDVRVEVAHITPPDGFLERTEGLWEAGPEVWPHIKKVSFRKFQVSVVPLEIQLETNYSREIEERINNIIRVLRRRGFNRELIEKALSKQHKDLFEKSRAAI